LLICTSSSAAATLLQLGLRRAFLLQAVRDVRLDRHVREQRIRLEHHVHGPLVRRHLREVFAVDQDLARRDRLEAGEHPQQRRLAGTRAAQQREQLALAHREVHIADHFGFAELLDDVDDLDKVLRARRGAGRGTKDGAPATGAPDWLFMMCCFSPAFDEQSPRGHQGLHDCWLTAARVSGPISARSTDGSADAGFQAAAA
jgi:hypothetical protein